MSRRNLARGWAVTLAVFAPATSFAQQISTNPPSGATTPAITELPTFAQAPAKDPWAGLTIGSGLSVSGGKGVKGGVGGDAYIGYNRELSNNVVISLQAVSGYTPNVYRWSRATGVDYAGANVMLGYDMGRFEPYVIAGVGLAKSNLGPPGRYDTSDSLNDIFNKSGGALATTTTVGAGFNYAVTDKLSMGMQFTATQVNPGGFAAPVLP